MVRTRGGPPQAIIHQLSVRDVDAALYLQLRLEAVRTKATTGEIFNQMMKARYQKADAPAKA